MNKSLTSLIKRTFIYRFQISTLSGLALCALLFQNCSGGFASQLASVSALGDRAKSKYQSVEGCPQIRLKFLGFHTYGEHDVDLFGAGGYEYGNGSVPFIRDYSVPPNFGSLVRSTSYVLGSSDCGLTWVRYAESVGPIILEGQTGGAYALNGPNHFTEDPAAAWANRGFVSRQNWDKNFSLIYPVFWETNHWAYQLASTELPPPVIGDASGSRKDNFYSPAVVSNDDAERSALLFFGGWRREYSRTAVPTCANYNHTSQSQRNYESVCKCDLYDQFGYPIDACTGDKIFVSTNASSVKGNSNPLDYRVYQGSGLWSPNGRDSSQFEPVISSYWVNVCHDSDPGSCPFVVRSVNDPTVVKLDAPEGGYKYVMYFTAENAISATAGMNHTYVATSMDGLAWGNFHALRAASGVRMPGGIAYNNSNGGVRAFGIGSKRQIVLSTDMTGDDPSTDAADKGKQFMLTVSQSEPWVVHEVRGFSKRNNGFDTDPASLASCTPYYPCDQTTVLSTDAGAQSTAIARAGFFTLTGAGIFYSNGQDAFCHVPTMGVYAIMGGSSSNTYGLSAYPSGMRNDGDCNVGVAPAGFFWIQDIGIFYSNGLDAFCHVTTMEAFGAMGGNNSNTFQFVTYPYQMRNDGDCR